MKYSALQITEEDHMDNFGAVRKPRRPFHTTGPSATTTVPSNCSCSSSSSISISSHNPTSARHECYLFLATLCGFFILVAALSLHNNEWVGDHPVDGVGNDVVVYSSSADSAAKTGTTTTMMNSLRGSTPTEESFEPVVDHDHLWWDDGGDHREQDTTKKTGPLSQSWGPRDHDDPLLSELPSDRNDLATLVLQEEDTAEYEMQLGTEQAVLARLDDEQGPGP